MMCDCVVLSLLLVCLLPHIPQVQCWPEGTYGLPMATSGCPASQDFEWEEGSRTQNTEDESHSSDPMHLAGVTPQMSDSVVQNFCMKTSYTQEGNYEFSKGTYCLFKKGECPSGFKSGWIYWDDDSSFLWDDEIQNHSGTLPDGEYDSNTKIFYCCRNDGPVSSALKLPKEAPFFLFKLGEECMQVEGMQASEEWVYWSDEATLNLNSQGGLHPSIQRSRYPWRYTKLFYCYYTERGVNTSVRTAMTVIYALGGAAALIVVILFLVCVLQKVCTYKSSDAGYEGAAMLTSCPTATSDVEPSVIYRPSNGYAKVQEAHKPPTYSEHFADSTPVAGVEAPTAPPVEENNKRITQPPTYEEVVQQKMTEFPIDVEAAS